MRADSRPGQPLAFVALCLGAWVAVRMGMAAVCGGAAPALPARAPAPVSRTPMALPPASAAKPVTALATAPVLPHGPMATAPTPDAPMLARAEPVLAPRFTLPRVTATPEDAADEAAMAARIAHAMRHHMLYLSASTLPAGRTANSGYSRPIGPNPLTIDLAGNGGPAPKRLRIGGYIFLRGGGLPGLGAANARYGGSQAALIARYALDSKDPERWQLTGRVNRGLAAGDPTELSPGVRWRPYAALPVALHAEYRLRGSGVHGPALFAAGGIGPVPLDHNFRLEAYAQAGFAKSDRTRGFFDAAAHATRPVAQQGSIRMAAGGGVWAGGQDGKRDGGGRLDLGPVLLVDLPGGERHFRLSAAWRERVAGTAAPGSGPSLTLSTSF